MPEPGDPLPPLVLLLPNTGLRRGEAFNLTWGDVDLRRGRLTVHGAGAKGGQTRVAPLNAEARAVLFGWKKRVPAGKHVFPGRTGGRRNNVAKAWYWRTLPSASNSTCCTIRSSVRGSPALTGSFLVALRWGWPRRTPMSPIRRWWRVPSIGFSLGTTGSRYWFWPATSRTASSRSLPDSVGSPSPQTVIPQTQNPARFLVGTWPLRFSTFVHGRGKVCPATRNMPGND